VVFHGGILFNHQRDAFAEDTNSVLHSLEGNGTLSACHVTLPASFHENPFLARKFETKKLI
jgi:hypothetical protein